MANEILVQIKGETYGPYGLVEIEKLILNGKIHAEDLGMVVGQNQWMKLVDMPQLKQNRPTGILEYRRTCQVCGKVWHSLVSRENQIQARNKSDSLMACSGGLQSCGTCGTLGAGTTTQASRNIGANQSELQRLKSCPECSSANYREETVQHVS